MKINKWIILGTIIIGLIISYYLGNIIPFEYLKPNLTSEDLTKGEYLKFITAAISACITFLAIIVALFKDDLREMWKRPVISFSFPDIKTIENLEGEFEEEHNIQANDYVSRVIIENKGNSPSLSSELFLEKLEFTPKDTSIKQFIETTGAPLIWNGTDHSSITIPSGGKKIISITKVTKPEKISLPDSVKTNNPSKLIIGKICTKKEENKGKWVATFVFHNQNNKPTRFEILIEWNGLWKGRLADFEKLYKIEIKK
jgi:hypothetical protein